jgi:muramoyltetrapeptide carboxypeptidase LdcA involved in peptidoglycan recycling
MNQKTSKLKVGDVVMVISPSGSLKKGSSVFKLAEENFLNVFGLKIKYSKNSGKLNSYGTSSIDERIRDFHEAFKNPQVKGIICSTGGFNSNELLKFIDWNLIKDNPKPFIGSSDNTVLINAIYTKTGIKTYFGPNYYKFGMKLGLKYTLDYFQKCLLESSAYAVLPSKKWSNDKWYKNQDERSFYQNKGYQIINEGEARGTIIGGNLCSLNLLQGTEFMPSLRSSILLIEDDDLAGDNTFGEFNRNLQSLLSLPGAESIKGIVVGRFQPSSGIDLKKIKYIINTKQELKNIPIIVNADFGHTDPMAVFPIGGILEMSAKNGVIDIKIINH